MTKIGRARERRRGHRKGATGERKGETIEGATVTSTRGEGKDGDWNDD